MTNKINIQIELTNNCNLACAECPQWQMKRPRQNMSEDVFKRVLEYIKALDPNTIIPHKDGEPLLHPQFTNYLLRMMDVAPIAKFDIYTNAHFLDGQFFSNILRKIVNRGNVLWFLVTFHRHDKKGKAYDLPTHKVLGALEAIKTYELPDVKFVLTSHKTDLVEQKDMDEWLEFWTGQKVFFPSIWDVHANTDINPWGERIKMKNTVTFDKCPYRDGLHLFIGVTGNVLPCCIDLEEDIIFGNIMKDNWEDISDRRDAFYEEILTESKYEVCQKCLTRPE